MREIDLSQLGRDPYELKNEVVKQKSLFEDWIGVDSGIEETTAEENQDTNVEVFAKLPKIGIETPIGKYTPDFAFVIKNEQGKMLSLIETKGYNLQQKEIPPLEL